MKPLKFKPEMIDFNVPDNGFNYPEDVKKYPDNGAYESKCKECGELFIGHKERYICAICSKRRIVDLMRGCDEAT